MKRSAMPVTLVIGALFASQVNAQEHDMTPEEAQTYLEKGKALYATHQVTIDGRETPNLIPYEIKMQYFFSTYVREGNGYRRALQKNVSSEDDAAILEFAKSYPKRREQDIENFSSSYLSEICPLAEKMQAIELAHAIEAHGQKYAEKRAAEYRRFIETLSPDSQLAIANFIDGRIKPVLTKDNPVSLAAADPVFFKEQVIGDCKFRLNGAVVESPPEGGSQQERELDSSGLAVTSAP